MEARAICSERYMVCYGAVDTVGLYMSAFWQGSGVVALATCWPFGNGVIAKVWLCMLPFCCGTTAIVGLHMMAMWQRSHSE